MRRAASMLVAGAALVTAAAVGTGSQGAIPVRGCATSQAGRIPADWVRIVAGPLTLHFSGPPAFLPAELFAPVRPRVYRPYKVVLRIATGAVATLSVPRAQRAVVALAYAKSSPSAPTHRGEMRVRAGQTAVRFKSCTNVDQPYTEFGGGFVVAGARCARLDVRVSGRARPLRLNVPFGRSCS